MWIAWAIWSAPRSRGRSTCAAIEERNHHSIVLRQANAPTAHTLGFKVASEDDLDRAADWFAKRNLPVAFPEVPYQGRTLRTADINGMPLEFYFKMDQAERLLQQYCRLSRRPHPAHRSHQLLHARRSGELRLLHRARLSADRIHRDRRSRDPKLWAVWLHRKGNVHDLAFTNGRGPRLHHIGVWTAGPLDILHICDVMAT